MTTYLVVIFYEGEFHEVVPQPNEQCADAFASGVAAGAAAYGSGSVWVYVWPRETDWSESGISGNEANRALDAIAAAVRGAS